MTEKSATPSRRVPPEKAATLNEILMAIELLSEIQFVRLEKYAAFKIKGLGRTALGRDAKDLLQQAITDTLDEDIRRWNKSVDFERHLKGAIRSIASKWRNQSDEDEQEVRLESEILRTNSDGQLDNPMLAARSTDPSPERQLDVRQQLEGLRQLLDGDVVALDVFDGLRGRMTGPEIQEALGLTQTQYETVMRRIYRKARVTVR